jgi:Putative MetA-pathway of phenol degradation
MTTARSGWSRWPEGYRALAAVCATTIALAVGPRVTRAQEADQPLTRDDLEEALRDRDKLISELMRRVEELERERAATGAREGPVPGPPPTPPQEPPPPEPESAVATAQPAPGEFQVDEQAAERALERTLVREGVLLLPFGQAEIQPSFSYTRRVVDVPFRVTEGGMSFVGEVESRRNEFDTSIGLRLGLPVDSQFELDIPYNIVNSSTVTKVGGAERDESESTGAGFGDIAVGLAKTLLQEEGWRPDLVARFTWDTDSGKTENDGVVLGGGFHELAGEISAVKRQDPLAFTSAAAYTTTFKKNDIEPGDQLSFVIGTVLAASPSTSLRLVLTQQFVDDLKVDGEGINGSDQVLGALSIGASSILGRGLFLDGQLDIGLTDDSPDYAVTLSLPIRFSTPGF